MNNPFLLLRTWPQLARTWRQRGACVRPSHVYAPQQPFVPMAILLDRADVVAAPDRAGTGTNALLLARPGLIAYAFGEGSLAAHRAAAAASGLRFALCERAGLATDIDRPEDLALLPPGLLSAA